MYPSDLRVVTIDFVNLSVHIRYVFDRQWPKQKEKEKKEREDAESRAAAEVEAKKREEESKAGPKPHELQQQPPELQSPERVTELPIDGVFEAPGDGGGVEVDNDAQLPAELPGDQVYWSSNSSGRSEEVERNRR